mmetsp:Transcript_44430/g.100453  ORF Transcript_44430/g.100453 Transcript_44430/m.100453 type:complete len:312 (-) Transcript_44430:372-1307(-)
MLHLRRVLPRGLDPQPVVGPDAGGVSQVRQAADPAHRHQRPGQHHRVPPGSPQERARGPGRCRGRMRGRRRGRGRGRRSGGRQLEGRGQLGRRWGRGGRRLVGALVDGDGGRGRIEHAGWTAKRRGGGAPRVAGRAWRRRAGRRRRGARVGFRIGGGGRRGGPPRGRGVAAAHGPGSQAPGAHRPREKLPRPPRLAAAQRSVQVGQVPHAAHSGLLREAPRRGRVQLSLVQAVQVLDPPPGQVSQARAVPHLLPGGPSAGTAQAQGAQHAPRVAAAHAQQRGAQQRHRVTRECERAGAAANAREKAHHHPR